MKRVTLFIASISIAILFVNSPELKAQSALKSTIYLKAPSFSILPKAYGYSTDYIGDYDILKSSGLGAEFGGYFYFNGGKEAIFNMGIAATFIDFNIHNKETYHAGIFESGFANNIDVVSMQAGLGPVISFNFGHELCLDLYGQFRVGYGSVNVSSNLYEYTDDFNNNDGGVLLKGQTGINLSFRKIYIYSDYNFGPFTYKYVDAFSNVQKAKINLTYFKVGIGLKFMPYSQIY